MVVSGVVGLGSWKFKRLAVVGLASSGQSPSFIADGGRDYVVTVGRCRVRDREASRGGLLS